MNSRSLRRFIVFVLLLAAINPVRSEQPSRHSHREFKIGMLVSLTGSWNSLGQNTVAALQLANERLQAAAKAEHGGYRFHLFVRDTQLDPAKALAGIEDLDKRGVKILIGPQSSAEVAMMKPYADGHNILVISQGSTASSLAISRDNTFRVCPHDKRDAEAMGALTPQAGMRTRVPLSAALTGDVNAAAFAASVGYPNPTFGLPDALQSLWQPVANAIEARTGITADAFALSAYDALFVVARALRDAGNLKDFASFKAAFVNTANAYSGVTGSTALDSAGDRLNADFDFWVVRLTNGNYSWARIGAYTNGTLTLF